ncbi:unnamed protein product [Mytilus edulis]|uniref:Laminin EGF-like domain-containing protein n=1 Tax=Mytilus edulis TaxID=6550 RepID=A0A8S3SBJ7_MYTED|nr:unnamed protein product [Mytilus edulis]
MDLRQVIRYRKELIFSRCSLRFRKIVKPEKLLGFITKLSGFIGIAENYILEISEVNCTTQRDCRKTKTLIAESYQNHFNIKHRLYKILKGTTESISVFNDPILDLIKRTHKCNIGEVIKFANGVILLAFKGQQVVIAHEKLTGSNASIILAVKEWSDLMYSIRNKVEDIKIECYTNINKYIKDDVQDTIYQTKMPSNKQAADSLKRKLDKKYVWLDWTPVSFYVWASFKSSQQFEGSHVHSIAVVKVFPFKNHIRHHSYCRCNTYFQGNNCQHYSGVNLADNVNATLAASARIPKLTTIYYELLDMQDSIDIFEYGSSYCLECKCNPAGSTSTECKDIYGQCFCKDHYFGEQCLDRHCKMDTFGEMGSCSKSCDYGGIKTRFRKQAISQKGRVNFVLVTQLNIIAASTNVVQALQLFKEQEMYTQRESM